MYAGARSKPSEKDAENRKKQWKSQGKRQLGKLFLSVNKSKYKKNNIVSNQTE